MRQLKFKKFLLFFLVAVFLFQATSALALEIKYPPVPGALTPQEIVQQLEAGKLAQAETLPLYFKYFFNLSFIIIVIICFGVIVYGGVLYLLSPAKPAILISAKNWIKSALLGLLILVSSYLILVTINPQLAIFQLPWLEEIELAPGPLGEKIKKEAAYTEIPLGQLIAHKISSQEAQEQLEALKKTAENVKERSQELGKKIQELTEAVENCTCGTSNCVPDTQIHWGIGGIHAIRCYCNPSAGQQCNINCDLAKIRNIMNEILPEDEEQGALPDLTKADKNLGIAQGPLTTDWSDMQKASMVITLGRDLVDYYTFLGVKKWLKTMGKHTTTTAFSESWPKVLATVETYLEKIETEAYLAWDINQENATTVGNILSPIDEIKDELLETPEETPETEAGILAHLNLAREKINNALLESTPENISQALSQIDHSILVQASSSLNVLGEKVQQIASSSQELQEADYQKSNIEKNCQEIEKIIESIIRREEDIPEEEKDTLEKGDILKIEDLRNEAAAALTIPTKIEKLSAIESLIDVIEWKIKLIWESPARIADPATFYLPTSETIKLEGIKIKETIISE